MARIEAVAPFLVEAETDWTFKGLQTAVLLSSPGTILEVCDLALSDNPSLQFCFSRLPTRPSCADTATEVCRALLECFVFLICGCFDVAGQSAFRHLL